MNPTGSLSEINFELYRGFIMNFLRELWAFMRKRKKLWLAPLIFILVVIGGLLILGQGSIVAPFIYTLF